MVKRAARRVEHRDEMQHIADEVLMRVEIENCPCKLDSEGRNPVLPDDLNSQYGDIIRFMGSFRDHIFTGPIRERTTLR